MHTKFRETSRILQTSRVNRCGISLTHASSWANLSNSSSFRVGTGLALLISKREARERNDKAMSGMEADHTYKSPGYKVALRGFLKSAEARQRDADEYEENKDTALWHVAVFASGITRQKLLPPLQVTNEETVVTG